MKFLPIILVLIGSMLLYTVELQRIPVHLNQDELGFSLNAYSLVKTGLDENGRSFPLYFWHLGVMWSTPYIVYLTALILTVLPLSEMSIRLPSVLVALVDIMLIYFVAKKLFKSEKLGVIAALFLALTPPHFMQGRILLDNLFIIPFLLGWLLLIIHYWQKPQPILLFYTGLVLGLGIHSYHAAKVMMPMYLLFTIGLFARDFWQNKKLLGLLMIGFILPVLPLIPWLAKYPDTLVDQVKYTQLYDTKLGPFSGIATLLTPQSIAERVSVFFAYFNPYFLFWHSDASLIHSTWRSGVFLLSLLIFLPLGIIRAIKEHKNRLLLLLLVGFFTAPIAAALVGDRYRISRALEILPFGVLLATYGCSYILSKKSTLAKIIVLMLFIIIGLQWTYFLYDYFTDYRIRSYAWFKYNIPGALESAIKQDADRATGSIYLDNRIEFVDRYWRFYTIKHNKEELLSKTYYFDPKTVDLSTLNKNSIIVYDFNNVNGLDQKIGPFTRTETIYEPDGISTFYLYRN